MCDNNNNAQICAEVEKLISNGQYDDALRKLDAVIDITPDAELLYTRGRLLWNLGRKTEAMSDYAAAVDIDPSSPAATALQMTRDIMDFYNHDLYNP